MSGTNAPRGQSREPMTVSSMMASNSGSGNVAMPVK